MIKTKTGSCKECQSGGPLIAGMCQWCYWRSREKKKSENPRWKEKMIERKEKKNDLTEWYNTQLSMRPYRCENCGEPLEQSMIINPRSIVCHILPKSSFPEVATHPLNRFFGCNSCHISWDGQGAEFRSKMPIWRHALKRYQHFVNQVYVENRRRAGNYLFL